MLSNFSSVVGTEDMIQDIFFKFVRNTLILLSVGPVWGSNPRPPSLLRSRFLGCHAMLPPKGNGCSQPNHIPLPLLANHSFGFIFKNQFAPNSSFETYRAQSENVFYLCIPSSETSQINMRISGLCLDLFKDAEKYRRRLNELCL